MAGYRNSFVFKNFIEKNSAEALKDLSYLLISIKQKPCTSLSQILLGLFICFIPFQIRTIIYSSDVFQNGNFNPFTTFFLYLNDFMLIGAVLSWGLAYWRKELKNAFEYGSPVVTLLMLSWIAILLGDTFFVENKILHLLNVFRLLELFLFYLLIVNQVLKTRTLLLLFIASMSFQSIVAIFQYLTQQSIGLQRLGEPIATPQTPGIAKMDVLGHKILRAFGTFPHANVLGGAITVAIVSIFFAFRKNWWIRTPFLILFTLALIFSFSRSALFASMTCFLIYFAVSERKIPLRNILLGISITLFFIVVFNLQNLLWQRLLFEDDAVGERSLYLHISQAMLVQKSWGVGLGSFTSLMQNFTTIKILPWIYQPVHNIFLLMVNEGGLIAGVLFIAIWIVLIAQSLKKNNSDSAKNKDILDDHAYDEKALMLGFFSIVLVIGLFDHYFISLYPGQVLLFLILGIGSSRLNEKLDHRKSTVL